MTSLVIDILTDVGAQDALAKEWDAVVPNSFLTTLSQSAWYFAWRDTHRAKENIIVTARDNGQLVGVLPLAKIQTDARGLYLPQITTFTGADYQAPVLATGASTSALTRMVDAAFEYFGPRYVYRWANIPTCDRAAEALAAHLRARGMGIWEEFRSAPRLNVSGRTLEEVEASWIPRHRTDVRRQRKRLAMKGNVVLWEPAQIDTAQKLLEEFFIVHDDKWLSQGQPGRFQDDRQQEYYRAIVKRLWGRGLHFSALRCGDVNVSFGLGFVSAGWIQWYRPTYRRDYENFSPGKIHIAFLVEEVCKRGWNGIDFLQGDEKYKLQWANESLQTVDYYASKRQWAPSYIWFSRGKPYLRDRLGPIYMRTKARMQRASIALRGAWTLRHKS